MATKPGNDQYIELMARVSADRRNGYACGYYVENGVDYIYFMRVVDDDWQMIGDPVTATITAGDRLGFSVVGDVLTAYHDTGGAWTAILTTTDDTFSDSGFIGFDSGGATWRMDDFGGGTIGGGSGMLPGGSWLAALGEWWGSLWAGVQRLGASLVAWVTPGRVAAKEAASNGLASKTGLAAELRPKEQYPPIGLDEYYYTAQVTCPAGTRTLPHAVSAFRENTYAYDCNGNMVTRTIGGQTYNLAYDAENHLTQVTGADTATFVYDGDGNRVKATLGGVTTIYIGNYAEWNDTTGTLTKYYYAGSDWVAMKTGSNTRYLLRDHPTLSLWTCLGSTTVSVAGVGTDPSLTLGTGHSELRCTAWGADKALIRRRSPGLSFPR